MLPAIAVLHVRAAPARPSGAILATIVGTAEVAIGIVAASGYSGVAAIVLLAMWWWICGKMWAETGILPRPFGLITAGLSVLALLYVTVALFGIALPNGWRLVEAVIGAWLLALAAVLYRSARDVPSA